ncbi:hypothetical protein A4X13_0g5141 [Tilletia indica]|uniref:Cytochrome P450 n=1 Tax=Tilletia indica TaxID=43049 RepID=A0A177TTQ0_9BASI|nr:hypothetical protein A4X13_0g5141 [Tilletia indica]
METFTRTFSNVKDGMPVSINSEVNSWPMLTALLSVVATLAFYQLVLAPPSSLRPKGSKIKPIFSSFPLLGSTGFYSDRVGFLRKHFGDPESSSFHGGARRITVRDSPVVLLAGDKDDAKTFFYSRTLKFTQAYRKLLSGLPSEITSSAIMDQDKADRMFREHLKQAIRGERLAKLAPLMCEDTIRAVKAIPDWSKGKGTIDPKALTFPLLFCMSMRTVGFADLSDKPEVMEELAGYYWAMENASSYWSTFFTDLPFRSSRTKKESGQKLFAALGKAAYRRVAEDVVEDDTVAMLMDQGLGADYAVRFVVSSLFAAIINSTSMSMWIMLYLGAHPELRQRANKELFDYLDSMAGRQGSGWGQKSRVEQLQELSLDEWEHGFPTIEATLKETMRTVMDGTVFRLNTSDSNKGDNSPKVHGENIRKGEFLGYWIGSTHFNSKIYSNPLRWDPDRWARGEGSRDMDFLGWGAGMHPCTGMRFAKLEIKNFTTTMLALMDWESYNPRTGKVYTLDTLPEPHMNSNDRTPLGPVALRFTRR